MGHCNFREYQRNLRRAVQDAVPPEKLLAIRDVMLRKALDGNVSAAKLLVQSFGLRLPRVRDERVLDEVRREAEFLALADDLRTSLDEEQRNQFARSLRRICEFGPNAAERN